MPQSTWAIDSTTWSNNPYVWSVGTYEVTAILSANVSQTNTGLTKYLSTATLGANAGMSASGGFQLVGNIVLGLSSGVASSTKQIFVESITLASTENLTSVGNKLYVDSITFGTTVNIPLAGTTTWNLETVVWSDAGSLVWGGNPTTVAIPVTATLNQVISELAGGEDAEKIASAILGLTSGATASGLLKMPGTVTLDNEQNMKFNINFEESISLGATSGTSSDNNFLWNDEAEDTGTTWTKVSDPDE